MPPPPTQLHPDTGTSSKACGTFRGFPSWPSLPTEMHSVLAHAASLCASFKVLKYESGRFDVNDTRGLMLFPGESYLEGSGVTPAIYEQYKRKGYQAVGPPGRSDLLASKASF